MSKFAKLSIILLRAAVGWFFLYQGIITILDSNWTLLPYIKNPGTFSNFYLSLASSPLLPYLNYTVKGLFVLVGLFLIIGLFVRIVGIIGILLQIFFYFPLLHFPYVESIYYIVDTHIIIIMAILFLFAIRAGEYFGLGSMFKFSRY